MELASRPKLHSHVGRLWGGHALGRKLAGAELGAEQRRARLPTRRWVALPRRLASDLLRPGYNSGRFRVKGRSVVPGRPLRTRAVAPHLGSLTPNLDLRLPFIWPLRSSLQQF